MKQGINYIITNESMLRFVNKTLQSRGCYFGEFKEDDLTVQFYGYHCGMVYLVVLDIFTKHFLRINT